VVTDPAIISIGARAARLLATHSDWVIAATFERSLYIRSGDAFVCIGDASIGDGPLNVLTPTGEAKSDRRLGQAFCATQHLRAEPALLGRARGLDPTYVEPVFDLSKLRIWQAPPWPLAVPQCDHEYVRAIEKSTCAAAPPASFMHALDESATFPDLVLVSARKGLDALERALATGEAAHADAAASALLGLGHGLTPSGDDVLAGALVAMHATGRTAVAATLTTAVRGQMRQLTSPLSAAFLEAACCGEPSAAVYQAITAALAGAAPNDVIAPLSVVGHASGFDLLTGILVVLGR
jgi:Protein of unknown function (DUF2877)